MFNHRKTDSAKFAHCGLKLRKVIEFFDFQSLMQHPLLSKTAKFPSHFCLLGGILSKESLNEKLDCPYRVELIPSLCMELGRYFSAAKHRAQCSRNTSCGYQSERSNNWVLLPKMNTASVIYFCTLSANLIQ